VHLGLSNRDAARSILSGGRSGGSLVLDGDRPFIRNSNNGYYGGNLEDITIQAWDGYSPLHEIKDDWSA
jgi:hypothetical protein